MNQTGFALAGLGGLQKRLDATLEEMKKQRILERIWEKDHTVWREDPAEISNRLGWLDLPESMTEKCPEILNFVEEAREAGFTRALLLGMGGSSLAPEVFRMVFGVQEGFLNLHVLDSTHPQKVQHFAEHLPLEKTLFIVSTKSGGTVETLSLFKYFYRKTADLVGAAANRQFIAITDPGSALEALAQELNFRQIFRNDPNIGGRFSALSYFGLVPAALIGVNIEEILKRARVAAEHSRLDPLQGNNKAAVLGAMMGAFAEAGQDKLTLLASPALRSLGAWIEQLIAESTGKDGRGILPVDLEPLQAPSVYQADRYFVYTRLVNETQLNERVSQLAEAGLPVLSSQLADRYDLGGEFFNWEFAAAAAGWKMGVQPFDQPDVESAKVAAREMMKAYQESGVLPQPAPVFQDDQCAVFAEDRPADLSEAWQTLLARLASQPRGYLGIHAYLPADSAVDAGLLAVRTELLRRFGLAVTVGYGPRFLHSTGQLHKGDAGRGVFLQITNEIKDDLPIPDSPKSGESSISFGVLINAQALGDARALQSKGRPVVRVHLKGDIYRGLKMLLDHLPERG